MSEIKLLSSEWRVCLLKLITVYQTEPNRLHIVSQCNSLSLACELLRFDSFVIHQLLHPLLFEMDGNFYNEYLYGETIGYDVELEDRLEHTITLLHKKCIRSLSSIDTGFLFKILLNQNESSVGNNNTGSLQSRVSAAQLISEILHIPIEIFLEQIEGDSSLLAAVLASKTQFTSVDSALTTSRSKAVLEILRDTSPVGMHISGYFIPTAPRTTLQRGSLIETKSMMSNLHRLSGAVLTSLPVLLYGALGCGKSCLIRELAQVKLYINLLVTRLYYSMYD
jgi:hypothetical protein